MSESNEIINRAADRLMWWRLPADFNPDGGIGFNPASGVTPENPSWPTGTNLLTAEQARAMLRQIIGDEIERLQAELAEARGLHLKLMGIIEQMVYDVSLEGRERRHEELSASMKNDESKP